MAKLAKRLQDVAEAAVLTYDLMRYRDPLALAEWRRMARPHLRQYEGVEAAYCDELKSWVSRFRTPTCFRFGPIRLPLVADEDIRALSLQAREIVLPALRRRYPRNGEGAYGLFGTAPRPGEVVVDAGANMGVFSAVAALAGSEVFAFEPQPSALEYLEATARLNGAVPGRIHVIPAALMDSEGAVQFTMDPSDTWGASAVLDRGQSVSFTAEATTLDAFAAKNGLAVGLLKADVEGAERAVLAGSRGILMGQRPDLNICVYHLPDDPEVIAGMVHQASEAYRVRFRQGKLFATVRDRHRR